MQYKQYNGLAVPAYQIHIRHHALQDESPEEFFENNHQDKRHCQSKTGPPAEEHQKALVAYSETGKIRENAKASCTVCAK
jgi:hypothetical protein